jgi:predicted nucleic acid-binding protein
VIVCCDTSFLVSLLNEEDVNFRAARSASARWDAHDFVICEVHLLELPGAVRAATHRPEGSIPAHIARQVINRFDRAVNSRLFLRRPVNITDSVVMARSLGDAHGWDKRHTTFDLWHLAAAWSLSTGTFLTFDERQGAIAKLLGMAS